MADFCPAVAIFGTNDRFFKTHFFVVLKYRPHTLRKISPPHQRCGCGHTGSPDCRRTGRFLYIARQLAAAGRRHARPHRHVKRLVLLVDGSTVVGFAETGSEQRSSKNRASFPTVDAYDVTSSKKGQISNPFVSTNCMPKSKFFSTPFKNTTQVS